MSAQNITFSAPNLQWLNQKINQKDNPSSVSDLVNDLIEQKRLSESSEIESIRVALTEGDESGLSDWSPEQVRSMVLERLDNDS